jgi:hypothetical protein
MPNHAERLFKLYSGLSRAHGQYRLFNRKSGKGKEEGVGNTIREGATVELWEKHISGEYGLGIVPIREDNTARFGAIDIDKYDHDLTRLASQVEKMELPLIVCRSKSGGAHLYLFAREDLPAVTVRNKLMEWAVLIGYSGVEVFPKQISLAGPEDVGNWINMPYFRAEDTNRYAVFGGKRLDLEGFLKVAETMAVTEESLEEVRPTNESPLVNGKFEGAPPCLQALAARGIDEGGRNNALFAIGVYLRKRFGDEDWKEKIDEYNQKFFTDPLGSREVQQIIKNVSKKSYGYRCEEQPMASVCNRQICLSREFGIGSQDGDPGVVFGGLVKINSDPPTWIWDVNGARIALQTQELKDQARFHARAIECINTWPNAVPPRKWQELIRQKLNNVEVVEAPPEASREGQMWILLQRYILEAPQARHRDELLQEKPWTHEGRTYFSASAFRKYLDRQRFNANERDIWGWLRNRDADHGFFNIKGRGFNWWSVPAFAQQTEEFDVPSILDQDEPM